MALADESNRVVQEFDFTNDDLNRHVKEFLRQMGTSLRLHCMNCRLAQRRGVLQGGSSLS